MGITTYQRHVEGAAKEIVAAKWSVKTKQYGGTIDLSTGTRRPVHSYKINALSPKQMDSLAEWVETAIDDWDNEIEAYADDVAREVLIQMGYDVAPDAGYDWICDHLGTYAEGIYVDAYSVVTDCVYEGWVMNER
jgi:hypothetical protein